MAEKYQFSKFLIQISYFYADFNLETKTYFEFYSIILSVRLNKNEINEIRKSYLIS